MSEIEEEMNLVLREAGIPLKVVFKPKKEKRSHGEIDLDKGIIYIYDADREEAWQTLAHEVVEFHFSNYLDSLQEFTAGLMKLVLKLFSSLKEEAVELTAQSLRKIFEVKGRKGEFEPTRRGD